jgi:hypothetical protein
MSDRWQIPACRSEFLQEFAGHLNPHLRDRYGWSSFYADIDSCEEEGETFERLCFWISTYDGAEICLNICEDKYIWVCVAALPKNEDSFKIDFCPDFALLSMERLAEAVLGTVSVSTRLNYDKSPEPILRQIWNFSGAVNIEGVI